VVLTVACVEWGDYCGLGALYVRRLREMVARHLSLPHEFVCLTDRPAAHSGIRTAQLTPGATGWWNKLELFRPGLFSGRVLFFDLDTVLVGSIDGLAQRKGIIHLRDWGWTKNDYGSGVMCWDAGEHAEVWERRAGAAERFRGDQDWLTAVGGWDSLPFPLLSRSAQAAQRKHRTCLMGGGGMGWGDELMAAGQARSVHERTGKRVEIVDRWGQRRTHAMWLGNPKIARLDEKGDFEKVVNGGNCRPYHLGKNDQRWVFNPDFRATPGEIYFTEAEQEFAAAHPPRIVISATLKAKASPNKQWGRKRWVEFVRLAREAGHRLVELGEKNDARLPGAGFIPTPDFRTACAVLARAPAYVGHEGGLHHAAAALGVPGVVIFGGFTPVELTGYELHRNLGVGIEKACGMRLRCGHCENEMAKIEPAKVLAELEGVLETSRRHLAS
jgi:hypothetical protein